MQHLRNCPLCGGRGVLLYNNIMASLNELDMSYEVHGCQDCGMTYAGKLPSEDEYQRYYSLLSKYDVGALSEDSIRMHQLLADIIAGYCAPGTRVLDIGCGDGHLLSCLKQRGMHELYGIDPAPHALQAAMNRYGIDTISTGFLKDIVDRAKTGSYSLFCLSAVLEHLSAPVKQMNGHKAEPVLLLKCRIWNRLTLFMRNRLVNYPWSTSTIFPDPPCKTCLLLWAVWKFVANG